jgi:flagellar L-ring protein precursor FlgH
MSRNVLPLVALAFAAAGLSACSTVKETVMGPQLSAVAYPAALMPMQQQVVPLREERPRPASANSLWRTGARAFFHDQRASKVGDILTVNIDINDTAAVQNETSTDRTSSFDGGVKALFGLESTIAKVLPNAPDPAHLLTSGTASKLEGAGSVKRSEAVSLTLAAVVTAILPNGNLVIQGRQEVRVNQELRELTVAGIVRPEDISAINTIKHTQIAEARVSYGGRGQITRVQGTPPGQALAEKFTPF